jgi:hypothetical protein
MQSHKIAYQFLMNNERSAKTSFRKHISSLSGGHKGDTVYHRHGMSVGCSHVHKLSEVEDRDNGIPFESHKEWEVRIPSFHKDKSTGDSRGLVSYRQDTGTYEHAPPQTNFSNKMDRVLYGP